MIICPNCGAEIEEDVAKCPYCDYINLPGAEKKFNKEIEEIKTNIVEVKKEPARALGRGFLGGVKNIVKTIIALVIVGIAITLLLLYQLRDEPREFLNAGQQVEASAYKALAEEQIKVAYEDKDIQQLAEIFDKAHSEDRVSLWGVAHYEVAQAASNYRSLMGCLTNLDKEKTSKREAEEITYYCFYFYYRAYGEDGAGIFDPVREQEILPIIQERLGYTDEDMENFRGDILNSGRVNRSPMYRATKKYYKNYH